MRYDGIKAVVWDCDETLWRGTLLDGDVPELPEGRRETCAELEGRGVIQTTASRNRRGDVKAALAHLEIAGHFVFVQADLEEPKSVMVRRFMEGSGLRREDQVLFVDDDPFQREQVRAALPGIRVAEPHEVDIEQFPQARTEEDRLRVRRLQHEELRQEAGKEHEGEYLDFLRTTEMWARFRTAERADMGRVVGLVARANQMSAMTREIDAAELDEFRSEGQLVVAESGDRWGDYGLVGVGVVADEGDARSIEALVISCRMRGKGLGSALLGWMINGGPSRTVARWKRTPYNGGMAALYEWYGFEATQEDGVRRLERWSLERERDVKLPDWIEVRP